MANILIVDDEMSIQRLLQRILEKAGHRCTLAGDSATARKIMVGEAFDLVICDIRLPGESGVELAGHISENYTDVARIMLTGIDDPEIARATIAYGAYDYLLKPVKKNRLLISVANALKRRELEIANRTYRENLEQRVMERTERLRGTIDRLEETRKALARSEAQYRQVVESANSIILRFDPEGRIRFFNTFAQAFFGYSEAEILGKSIFETIVPVVDDNGKAVKQVLEAIRRDPDAFKSNTNQNVAKDGQRFWVSWTNRAILDENGAVAEILSIGNDITQTVFSEERIRLMATAIEQMDECVVITDGEGRIEYVNPAFEAVSGYAAAEVVGRHRGILHPEPYDGTDRKDSLPPYKTDTVWRGTYFSRKKNGNAYKVKATLSPVKNGESRITHYVIIKQDITQDLKMEAQLRQAQKLEAIGQLAAGIAHEINTPMQYIGDNIHFLETGYKVLQPVLEKIGEIPELPGDEASCHAFVEALHKISRETQLDFIISEIPATIRDTLEGIESVAKIVRAMKEFSHPGVENKDNYDLNRAIEQTVIVARNEWKYVADLDVSLDPTIPVFLCYAAEINQSILNMIINAAHAIADRVQTDGNGRGRIGIETRRLGEWAEIRISDTGSGIPERVRDRVFDPFFTTKPVGKGTGQGLALAYSAIVEKHGGELTFETEVGKGTTFIARLPLSE